MKFERTPIRCFIFLVICFLLVGTIQTVWTQDVTPGSPEAKISSFLLSKIRAIENQANKEGLSKNQISQRFNSKSFYIDNYNRIFVTIVPITGRSAQSKKDVEALGGKIHLEGADYYYCLVPIDQLRKLATSKNILFIGHPPLSSAHTGDTCSAGDAQLFANKARDLFYKAGKDIKVGVISTGMKNREASITSHDLPDNIQYVDSADQYTGSEGTAMMEIIHDLAPDAELWFGAIGSHGQSPPSVPLDMANRINHLAEAGCKIIVDDIGWLRGDSWFQDREITAAIEGFVQNGGTYVCSAGNNARTMWAGETYPGAFQQRNWMTFSAFDTNLTVTVSNATKLIITLQWADTWINPSTDLDLYLYNGSSYLSSATRSGANPEEVIEINADSGSTLNFTRNIRVEWYNYSVGEKHIKCPSSKPFGHNPA